jgi:pilus assembly protein Flp/PilA
MNSLLLNLNIKFQILMDREDGQDLVEYALAVALIAFAAVAGTRALAAGIGIAFSNLSSMLSSSIA